MAWGAPFRHPMLWCVQGEDLLPSQLEESKGHSSRNLGGLLEAKSSGHSKVCADVASIERSQNTIPGDGWCLFSETSNDSPFMICTFLPLLIWFFQTSAVLHLLFSSGLKKIFSFHLYANKTDLSCEWGHYYSFVFPNKLSGMMSTQLHHTCCSCLLFPFCEGLWSR